MFLMSKVYTKKSIMSLFFILINLSLFSQPLELPAFIDSRAVIYRENYSLEYAEEYEQARWVAYELTRSEVMGNAPRRNSFKSDDEVNTGSATLSDYAGSGYDRGHLAPAADMKMSEQSMADSFYLSNMSPQDPGFNRGIWSELESCVRTWAYDNESILVVTGPVLVREDYPVIGESRVSVPEYYYKVILDITPPEMKGIGFLLPNKRALSPLSTHALSIDRIEKLVGIDFFPGVEDSLENALEEEYDISLWPFDRFLQSEHRDTSE
jgi:endonuclease G